VNGVPRARLLLAQTALVAFGVVAYRGVGHKLVDIATSGASDDTVHVRTSADALVEWTLLAALALLAAQLAWRAWSARRPTSTSAALAPSAPSRRRLWLFRTAMLAIALAPWLVLYPVLYWYLIEVRLEDPLGFRGAEPSEPIFPRLGDDDLVQLGWAHRATRPPGSSYVAVDPVKPPGNYRVGLFGGSNVQGLEAAHGHDIASLLAGQLAAAGAPHVEPINFGVSSYGMGQATLLWELVGRRYELDAVVMLPMFFHAVRDDTFHFYADRYDPVHARYVLDGDEPRLVRVRGRSRPEATRIYFGLPPRWEYLRFDARTPVALLPWLPRSAFGRWNPLYYWSSDTDEMPALYARLFERIAGEVGAVVVVVSDERLADALDSQIDDDRIALIRSPLSAIGTAHSSLYRAPQSHRSALGNEFVASELRAHLLGGSAPRSAAVRLGDALLPARPGAARPPPRLLATAQRVALVVGDAEVAGFSRRAHPSDPPWRLEADLDTAADAVENLLAVETDDGLAFAPLATSVDEQAAVELELHSGDDILRLPVGTAVPSAGPVSSLQLHSEFGTRHSQSDWDIAYRFARTPWCPSLRLTSSRTIDRVELLVAGRPALRGEIRERSRHALSPRIRRALFGASPSSLDVVFAPRVADFAAIRAREGQYLPIAKFPRRGTLDLEIVDAAGEAWRYPLLGIERFELTSRSPPLQ